MRGFLRRIRDGRRTKGLEVLGAHAPATERLTVEGKKKGMSLLLGLGV